MQLDMIFIKNGQYRHSKFSLLIHSDSLKKIVKLRTDGGSNTHEDGTKTRTKEEIKTCVQYNEEG
jgi:hypothetical protein